MKYTIDKNIPLPPPDKMLDGRRGLPRLIDMEVGDSFVVAFEDTVSPSHLRNCLTQQVLRTRRKKGDSLRPDQLTFSIGMDSGGYRVWRLS